MGGSYSHVLHESSNRIGDNIQLFISDEGLMRVFFNDDEGYIYSIVNKNSNYRRIIELSKDKKVSGVKFVDQKLNTFNFPKYGGEKNQSDRTPYFVYKYDNTNGRADTFYFQERKYIRPNLETPIYDTRGYSDILPKVYSYTSRQFLETDEKDEESSENFWGQFYEGFGFFSQDDNFNNVSNNNYILKELALGAIDVYQAVNSDFDIKDSIDDTVSSPIRIAPNKRIIEAKSNSKFMKVVMPKYKFLDNSNFTRNEDGEYYKGIFTIYSFGDSILYLSRLNEIGTIDNPSGEIQKINLYNLLDPSIPAVDQYHSDIVLDSSQNPIDMNFKNIFSRPYFVFSTPNITLANNSQLVFGHTEYNLSPTNLNFNYVSIHKQAQNPRILVGPEKNSDGEYDWNETKIYVTYITEHPDTGVLDLKLMITNNKEIRKIREKYTAFTSRFSGRTIETLSVGTITAENPKFPSSNGKFGIGLYDPQTLSYITQPINDISSFIIPDDNIGDVLIVMATGVAPKYFSIVPEEITLAENIQQHYDITLEGSKLRIAYMKVNGSFEKYDLHYMVYDTSKKSQDSDITIESDIPYDSNEYLPNYKPLCISRSGYDDTHIVYKVKDTNTYKIKYWTDSIYVPRGTTEDSNYFKIVTHGQTIDRKYPEVSLFYDLQTWQPAISESKFYPHILTPLTSNTTYETYDLDKIYLEFDFIITGMRSNEMIFLSAGGEGNEFIFKINKNDTPNNNLFVNDVDLDIILDFNKHYHLILFYDKHNKYLRIKYREFDNIFTEKVITDVVINVTKGSFRVGYSPFSDETKYFLNENETLSNGKIFNVVVYAVDDTEIMKCDILKNAFTASWERKHNGAGGDTPDPAVDYVVRSNLYVNRNPRPGYDSEFNLLGYDPGSNNRIVGSTMGKFGKITYNNNTWGYSLDDEYRNTIGADYGKVYDVIKSASTDGDDQLFFYILTDTAYKKFIDTGENNFFVGETYTYQIKNIKNEFTEQDKILSFEKKDVYIHKLWFLQKNDIGFERLEDQKITIFSMDYFIDNEKNIEQIWAVGRYYDSSNNNFYGKIYYSNDIGETWFENTNHLLYPKPESNLNSLENINYYTYVKTFVDANGGKWLWLGGRDYLITYSNNYDNGTVSEDIDELGKYWYILGDENPVGDEIDDYTPGGVHFNRMYGETNKFKRKPFILGIQRNISFIYPVLINSENSKKIFNSDPNNDDFHVWVGTNADHPLDKDFTKKMGGSYFSFEGYGAFGYDPNYIKYVVVAVSMVYRIGNTYYETDLSDFQVIQFGESNKFGPIISINSDKNEDDAPDFFHEYRIYRCDPIEKIINGENDIFGSDIDPDRINNSHIQDNLDDYINECTLTKKSVSAAINIDFVVNTWTLYKDELNYISVFENVREFFYPSIQNKQNDFIGTYNMVFRANELSLRKRRDDNIVLYKKEYISPTLHSSVGHKINFTAIEFKNTNTCIISSDACVFVSTDGGATLQQIFTHYNFVELYKLGRMVRGVNITLTSGPQQYDYRVLSNSIPWLFGAETITVANYNYNATDTGIVKNDWTPETKKDNRISFWDPGPEIKFSGTTNTGVVDTKNRILNKEFITDNKFQAFDDDNFVHYTEEDGDFTLFYYKNDEVDWHGFELSDVINSSSISKSHSSVLFIKNNDNPLIISYIDDDDFDIRGFYFIRQTPPTPSLKDPGISANRLYPYEDNYSVLLVTQINDMLWNPYLETTTDPTTPTIDFKFYYYENKNNEGFKLLEPEPPNSYDKSQYVRFFLEPGTKYEFKVQIRSDMYGISNDSKVVTITTFNDPALIDNLKSSSSYIANILKWEVKLSSSFDLEGVNTGKQLVYYYDIYKHSSKKSAPYIETIAVAPFIINGTLRENSELNCDFSFILDTTSEFTYEYTWENSLDNDQYTVISSDSGVSNGDITNVTYTLQDTDIGKWIRLKVVKQDKNNILLDETIFSVPVGLVVGENDELNQQLNPQNIPTGPNVTSVTYYDTNVTLDTVYTYYIYPKNKLAQRNVFGKLLWNTSTYIFNGVPTNFKLKYDLLTNSIILSWTNASINIDTDVISYTISYKVKQILNKVESVTALNEKTITIPNIKINGSYAFSVMAVFTDQNGNVTESEYSNELYFDHDFEVIENIVITYNNDTDFIDFKWSEPLNPYKPTHYTISMCKKDETLIQFPTHEENMIDVPSYQTNGYNLYPGVYSVKITPYYNFNVNGEIVVLEGVPQLSSVTIPFHSIRRLRYSVLDDKVTLYWNKVSGDKLRYRVLKSPINNGDQCNCPTNSWTIFVCQSSYNEDEGWCDPTKIIQPNSYSYDVSVEYYSDDEEDNYPCGNEYITNPIICCPEKITDTVISLQNNLINRNPEKINIEFNISELYKSELSNSNVENKLLQYDTVKVLLKYTGEDPLFPGFIKPSYNLNKFKLLNSDNEELNSSLVSVSTYQDNRQVIVIRYNGETTNLENVINIEISGHNDTFYNNSEILGIQYNKQLSVQICRNEKIIVRMFDSDCETDLFIPFPPLDFFCPDNLNSQITFDNNIIHNNPNKITIDFYINNLLKGDIIKVIFTYEGTSENFIGIVKSPPQKPDLITLKNWSVELNEHDLTVQDYSNGKQEISFTYNGDDINDPSSRIFICIEGNYYNLEDSNTYIKKEIGPPYNRTDYTRDLQKYTVQIIRNGSITAKMQPDDDTCDDYYQRFPLLECPYSIDEEKTLIVFENSIINNNPNSISIEFPYNKLIKGDQIRITFIYDDYEIRDPPFPGFFKANESVKNDIILCKLDKKTKSSSPLPIWKDNTIYTNYYENSQEIIVTYGGEGEGEQEESFGVDERIMLKIKGGENTFFNNDYFSALTNRFFQNKKKIQVNVLREGYVIGRIYGWNSNEQKDCRLDQPVWYPKLECPYSIDEEKTLIVFENPIINNNPNSISIEFPYNKLIKGDQIRLTFNYDYDEYLLRFYPDEIRDVPFPGFFKNGMNGQDDIILCKLKYVNPTATTTTPTFPPPPPIQQETELVYTSVAPEAYVENSQEIIVTYNGEEEESFGDDERIMVKIKGGEDTFYSNDYFLDFGNSFPQYIKKIQINVLRYGSVIGRIYDWNRYEQKDCRLDQPIIYPSLECPCNIENISVYFEQLMENVNPNEMTISFDLFKLKKCDEILIIFDLNITKDQSDDLTNWQTNTYSGLFTNKDNFNTEGISENTLLYEAETLLDIRVKSVEFDTTTKRQILKIKYEGDVEYTSKTSFMLMLFNSGDSELFNNHGPATDPNKMYKITMNVIRNGYLIARYYNEDSRESCKDDQFIEVGVITPEPTCPDNIRADYIEGNGNDPEKLSSLSVDFESYYEGTIPKVITTKFSLKTLKKNHKIEITYRYKYSSEDSSFDPDFKGFFKTKEGLTVTCLDSNYNFDDANGNGVNTDERTIDGFVIEYITAYKNNQQTIVIRYSGEDDLTKEDIWQGYHIIISGDENSMFTNPTVFPPINSQTGKYGPLHQFKINVKDNNDPQTIVARNFAFDCNQDEWIDFGELKRCIKPITDFSFILGDEKEHEFDTVGILGDYLSGSRISQYKFTFKSPVNIKKGDKISIFINFYNTLNEFTAAQNQKILDDYRKGKEFQNGDYTIMNNYDINPEKIIKSDISNYNITFNPDLGLEAMSSKWTDLPKYEQEIIFYVPPNGKEITASQTIEITIRNSDDALFGRSPGYQWGVKASIQHKKNNNEILSQYQEGKCLNNTLKYEIYKHKTQVDNREERDDESAGGGNWGRRLFYPNIALTFDSS